MGQDNSKLPKRRIEHAERVKLLCAENIASMKLSRAEVNTLKQLYNRLAALSPEDEYIDKQTFLHYFPLEGVLAERLFATFDKDKNNVIDYEEFLGGLALCLAGTVDEKFQLVFDLYNIDDGDGISEDELAIVLKSTLIAAKAIVEPTTNSKLDEDIVRDLFDIDQHVKRVVHDAFEQCDASQTGELSPEEFRNWAERHSYILDIIFSHKSFTDKQKISENITVAAIKAAEMNSVRCQKQTWIDTPNIKEDQLGNSLGYNKATYLWSPVFPVMLKAPKARGEHTACVYQGSLYVLGGRGACAAFKDFWKYDLALNNWSEIPHVGERPTHIFGHSAVINKGWMYVYGGEFESSETFVWKYNFDCNKWEKISSGMLPDNKTPMNRRYQTAVVYSNKMYIFGGLIEMRGSTDELWCFDLVEHTWEALCQWKNNCNRPGKRYEHSAVVYNRAMWIAGGLEIFTPRNDVWKWEFEKSVWCKIKNKGGPFPIRGHRAVRCGNGMLIYGGTTNAEYQHKVWRFEFENQSWSLITPHGGVAPPARSAAAVVILSTFALPLLPPQVANPTQACTPNTSTKSVEGIRPHSSPVSTQKATPSQERKLRHWSTSSESLYHSPSVSASDKRSSAGRLDVYGENFISFANPCYYSSSEWKACKDDIYPSQKTLKDCSLSLEGHEETLPEEEMTKLGEASCKVFEGRKSKDKPGTGRSTEFSHPKEGLCIFLIGGKFHGNNDCLSKGVDIWRCDVTKRRKRSKKIRKIKVQMADATVAPLTDTDSSFISFDEQSNKVSNASTLAKRQDFERKSSSIPDRESFLKTANRPVTCDEHAFTGSVDSYHGDLIITDLACSSEPFVN